MVDEYLSEREQAEQLRHWLRENWIWLIAGVALALGGYYGWRWWESHQASRSLAAGERLTVMLDSLGRNAIEEGRRIGGEIIAEYPDTPYADQAALVLARVDVDAGKLADAEQRLADVAGQSDDPDLRLVARLRLARVQLAQGRYDDALGTLDAIEEPAALARVQELRGDVKLAQGDRAGALEAWRLAQTAAERAGQPLVDLELLRFKIDEVAGALAATKKEGP